MTLEEFEAFCYEQSRKVREAKKKGAEENRKRREELLAWLEENREHRYEIRSKRGYYEVLRDGEFYCSADTYGEAMKDIPN